MLLKDSSEHHYEVCKITARQLCDRKCGDLCADCIRMARAIFRELYSAGYSVERHGGKQ